MAQFRGTLDNGRTETSRLGHKPNGMTATLNGWDVGARVTIEHEDGRDVVRVYATRGSSPKGGVRLIAEFDAYEQGAPIARSNGLYVVEESEA